jgi:hypothetical protein
MWGREKAYQTVWQKDLPMASRRDLLMAQGTVRE